MKTATSSAASSRSSTSRSPHGTCENPGRSGPKRLVNAGVAADVEHAEPAERVEVAVAVRVPEVGALGPRPAAVETDRPQQPHELRVDRLRVQVERLGAALLDQLAEPTHARIMARPMSKPRLAGKVALVTGASRGGGKGIALVLGEEGAIVYVTGRSVRGEPTTLGRSGTIDDTADQLTARGGTGIAVRCDHTDDAQVEALFERIRREQG